MKYLFYTLFFASFAFSQQLTRDSMSKVVKDFENNLMWVDNKDTVTKLMTHKEALAFCENLSHGGYSTWRLPMIEEFKTVVDKNRKTNIHKAFKFNLPTGYWAYKAHVRTFWYYADYMNFVSGTAYFDNRKVNKYVRCARNIK